MKLIAEKLPSVQLHFHLRVSHPPASAAAVLLRSNSISLIWPADVAETLLQPENQTSPRIHLSPVPKETNKKVQAATMTAKEGLLMLMLAWLSLTSHCQ